MMYSEEMARAWKKLNKPYPITVDIVGHANCLTVRVYEEEVLRYNTAARLSIMSYLHSVCDVIQSFGVECTVEGFPIAPKIS